MSDAEPRRDRSEVALVVLLYVVPLTATAAFLAWTGLPGLALALLAVEALVSAAVVVAKRPDDAGPGLGRLAPALGVAGLAAGLGAVLLLSRGV